MATNSFLEFNSNKTNIQSDVDYSTEAHRINGVSGIAKSTVHNKLFRQVSVMAAAIGEFIKNAGYDASDSSVSALVTAITNSFASKSALDAKNTFETAGGTGTAITLSSALTTDKYSTTFIASANNSGAATSVNSKPLYKPGTTTAPTLMSGKAYTIWYSVSGGCFFIKASAEGNAAAGDVLAGKTYSNDTDTGLTGAMPNNGAVSQSLAINGSYTIPAGYHNGSGQVTQSIPTKGVQTYTPGTTSQTIASGQYLTGTQTIAGDSNLIESNIVSGVSIFGKIGTAPKIYSGSTLCDSYNSTFYYYSSSGGETSTSGYARLNVTGLSFPSVPSLIVAWYSFSGSGGWVYTSTYHSSVSTAGQRCITMTSSNGFFHTQQYNANTAAYVSTSGFCLPVPNLSTTWNWIAIL